MNERKTRSLLWHMTDGELIREYLYSDDPVVRELVWRLDDYRSEFESLAHRLDQHRHDTAKILAKWERATKKLHEGVADLQDTPWYRPEEYQLRDIG